MQSKNNFRFLLLPVFCVLLTVAALAQTSNVKIKQGELKSLGGNWEGELVYLDYKDGKSKVTLKVKTDNNWAKPTLSRNVIFTEPNGREIKSSSTLVLASDGQSLTEDKQIWKITKNAFDKSRDERTIVLETRADDNDKPADLKKTIVIGKDSYVVTKEVRYENTQDYFFRNEFRFRKVK